MTKSISHLAPPPNTLASIGPIARSSVVGTVCDRLQAEILSGRLAAGTRLPSERELALTLGVNRLTLRAALTRLEALGLVATRHGAGTVVTVWRERASLDSLATLASTMTPKEPAWRELMAAVLEMRRILTAEAVALAAERHTPEDCAILEALAAEQGARAGDPIAFAKGDIAFQRAVIGAARNVALELVLNSFARFPDELPGLVAMLYDRVDGASELYALTIALVRAGDAEAARKTVRTLLEAADDAWQRRHLTPASEPPPRRAR